MQLNLDIKSLPDSDLTLYPTGVEFAAAIFTPRQMVAYSEMLGSIISFNWYSLLVERDGVDVFKFFNRWLGVPNSHENYYINNANKTPVETPHPDFLVIGTCLINFRIT